MSIPFVSRAQIVLIVLLAAPGWQTSPVGAAEDFADLSAAIQAANRGGNSAIALSGDITLTAPLPAITGELAIEGGGHAISGDGKHRIFDVSGGALTLTNLTLTDGRAAQGGAIGLRNGARVTIEDATLSENSAMNGGAIATSSKADELTVYGSSFVNNRADRNAAAIFANGGVIHIENSIFERNCAELAAHAVDINLTSPREERSVDSDGCLHVRYIWTRPEDVSRPLYGTGGAISLQNGGRATVVASTFSKNKGKSGGAINMLSSAAMLEVSGSSFSQNYAHNAAAIHFDGGKALITQSSFLDNFSENTGGALVANAGEVAIANSAFHNNRASSQGGALAAAGADVAMTHLTMVNNRTTNSGADTIHRTGGGVRLRNSIIFNSGASEDCVGGLDQMVGNLSADGTCALLASEDPLLDRQTGEPAWYPLQDFSPAVDAADPDYCQEVDQIGTARPQGGGCDIGAIEAIDALPMAPPI